MMPWLRLRAHLHSSSMTMYGQVESVGQCGPNKRIHCRKCTHHFNGNVGRIREHLQGKSGAVKGCTFSETGDRRRVVDEIKSLLHTPPKSNKRKLEVTDIEGASSAGFQQTPIQKGLKAAGRGGIDQAMSDWAYEAGISFNVLR